MLLVGALGLAAPGLADAQPATTRLSVGRGGAEGDRLSIAPAISADGRWVTFDSEASNLVRGDTNGAADVFVHDRETRMTTRVSLGPGGAEGNGSSQAPAISASGRWVVFQSDATNLVAGDRNGAKDVFVHDRQTGTTTRVSVRARGGESNGNSYEPAISADGRWVAFHSVASNLVAGDRNRRTDVFLRDWQTGTTTRVSVGSGGAEGNGSSLRPAISADGRWVAFSSWASNLVAGDTNDSEDVFVHDREAGTTTRVSVGRGGAEGNRSSYAPAISADGRWVAFESGTENLVAGDTRRFAWHVYVHDRRTGTTTRVSVGPGGVQGNGWSHDPAISPDGRWVTFSSWASDLVADDTNDTQDVFVRDRQTGTTTRVSLGPGGAEGNDRSSYPAISANGRWVVFQSDASNLVTGDTNNAEDVFVHDGEIGTTATR